jgi:hypothetical protein
MHRFITALILGLALLAPAIAFAETRAVAPSKLESNFGETIPVPFEWRFGNPLLTPISEHFFFVYRSLTPTRFQCFGNGSASGNPVTFELEECDGNGTNCTSLSGLTTNTSNYTAQSDTSFADLTAEDVAAGGRIRVKEGQYLRVFLTALAGTQTATTCFVNYVYF